MKSVVLNESDLNYLRTGKKFFSISKSKIKFPTLKAGEHIQLISGNGKTSYLGYYSSMMNDDRVRLFGVGHDFETLFLDKITELFEIKNRIWGSDGCGRLIHGESDDLPGLICDVYNNAALIKLEDCGYDLYKNFIASSIGRVTSKQVYFINSNKADLINDENELPKEILVTENGIKFSLRRENLQKAGFYHDHKFNRLKLQKWLKTFTHLNKNGVDLFSYIGGWGANLLSSGVKSVDFVDQAPLGEDIAKLSQLNNFDQNIQFIHQDVFEYLKTCKEKYSVICCDPPAFAKSIKQKKNAINGYQKLASLLLRVSQDEVVICFGSCTHYVDILELDKVLTNAFEMGGYKTRLVDIGTQSMDHSNSGLSDKSNYIKSYIYYLKRRK